MLRILFLLLTLSIISCTSDPTPTLPAMLLEPGSEREIAFTDKQDAFWVTRSGGYNSSSWHGLTAAKQAYLEDVFISANGALLPRELAEVTVNPVKLVRKYPKLGIQETWTLLDGQHTLLVQLEADKAIKWNIQAAIQGGSQVDDFDISTIDQELNIHIKRLDNMSSRFPHMKIWFSQAMEWTPAGVVNKPLYNAFLTQQAELLDSRRLTIKISLSKHKENSNINVALIEQSIAERENRIDHFLKQTPFNSNLTELNDAIAWAHASVDALVMKQLGTGIYAGLPWFDDYWGRDTFISYAGAVLVSGRFEAARQILTAFAELQNIDTSDKNYGRIPNRARPEDVIYNTTDGTPWFVRSVWDYYRYSGDEAFLSQMWPAIQHATGGSLKNWTDTEGLLRHTDADTWMDARGPDGAWSPRGDRAIDIQFIWRDQLEITKRLAIQFNDKELEQRVAETLLKLETGLQQFLSDDGTFLVDHINADGSQDEQIRPNVFLVPPLFQETCDWSSFKTLAPQLITRNGVLSLSQNDPNFHPYHHLPGMYVQDAAYHNGIIWTWNSAATITQAIHFQQYHYAQALFDDLTNQILNRGAVGTIAEVTDAWPREGEIRLSGTFTQAWSVAEYLRSFYQDILGIQPDMTRSQVSISPRLLQGMERADFSVPVGDDFWEFKYIESESSFDIDIKRSQNGPVSLVLAVRNRANIVHLNLDWNQKNIQLRCEKQMGQWTVPGSISDYQVRLESLPYAVDSLPFCRIDTSIEIPALKGPDHRLLNDSEVVKKFQSDSIVLQLQDPSGDDRGDSGQYSYPANPVFSPGIADILKFQIGKNNQDYFFDIEFDKLVDPGWHPEYGYQLTYVTVGISYSSKTGTSELGKNSRAQFKNGFKADQILHISGGILLVGDTHQALAEFIPRNSVETIGDVAAGVVRFALPRSIFEHDLKTANFQIAVGCQDDHGGAGIGDYRDVKGAVSEWAGGGNNNSAGSNVYDWLIPSNNIQ